MSQQDDFTARQLEILQLMADDNTLEEAADELGISSWTAYAHLNKGRTTMGAHTTNYLIAAALRRGLID